MKPSTIKGIYPWKFVGTIILSWYFISYALGDPEHTLANWNLVDNIDLIIHEAGHFIFMFFGEFIHVLSGSFLQILVPVVFAGYFFLLRQWFSGSAILFWIGQNIISVATYLGDAVSQQLPLLGGDGVMHDWGYLLSQTGLLGYTDLIARILNSLGFAVIIIASLLCLFWSCDDSIRQKVKGFFGVGAGI
jgi:hypothetical protein